MSEYIHILRLDYIPFFAFIHCGRPVKGVRRIRKNVFSAMLRIFFDL